MADTAPPVAAEHHGNLIIHLARGREWRGGERQVIQLARALNRAGHWRQLLVTRAGSLLASAARDAALTLVESPWRAALDPRVVGTVLGQARAESDLTLVHAHDSHSLVLGVLASRILHCPLIATRRSVTVPGRLWRVPDRVIAISGAVEVALRAGGVPPSAIALIPSAIDVAALAAQRVGSRDNGPPDLIAIGALTREKGHRVLVEAFARVATHLPRATLTILGEGPERGPIEALVRRHGLSSRVALPGDVPDPAGRLARATLLVQPSWREALGTTVLEAMAVGTAVIASAVGGLNELLAGGAGVLVPPGDPASLSEAITALCENPARRDMLCQSAAQRVRQYDVSGMAERCTEVYRSALNRPGR
ncbi:MAG: glycosyltransferase [Gemmatimonadota bacterium]|nr:glycosyltransferase [Gemmatimonadota bacterium]MDH4349072.1 glycosyltransferase [Gemmatimonadota bacterium]MDH5282446.1 glycosyltransferase [Gemmatimonadota bacterium]